MKIRAEINETETNKTIKQIKETKSCFFEKIKKLIKFQADSSTKGDKDSNL